MVVPDRLSGYSDYTATQNRAGVVRPPVMALVELCRLHKESQHVVNKRFKETGHDVALVATRRKSKYYNAAQLRQWAATHLTSQ